MPSEFSRAAFTIEALERAVREKAIECEILIGLIKHRGGDPQLTKSDLPTLRGPKARNRSDNLFEKLETAEATERWLWHVLIKLSGKTVFPEKILTAGLAVLPKNPVQPKHPWRPKKSENQTVDGQLLQVVIWIQNSFKNRGNTIDVEKASDLRKICELARRKIPWVLARTGQDEEALKRMVDRVRREMRRRKAVRK